MEAKPRAGHCISFPDQKKGLLLIFCVKLFLIYWDPLQDDSFLDLFAGSGSVGIEAASRGAREVVLVEKNKKIASIAQKNIESCGYKDQMLYY